MPSYEHLLDTDIDFEKITDRVWAAHVLGAPYDRELTEAPQMAREQAEKIAADIVSQGGPVMRGELLTIDTQAVALIAYLQRIGTDISRRCPSRWRRPRGSQPAVDRRSRSGGRDRRLW